jgi:hypothetical protein
MKRCWLACCTSVVVACENCLDSAKSRLGHNKLRTLLFGQMADRLRSVAGTEKSIMAST